MMMLKPNITINAKATAILTRILATMRVATGSEQLTLKNRYSRNIPTTSQNSYPELVSLYPCFSANGLTTDILNAKKSIKAKSNTMKQSKVIEEVTKLFTGSSVFLARIWLQQAGI